MFRVSVVIISVIHVLVFGMHMSAFAAEGKDVLRIWHTESEPASIAAMEEIITGFEALYPDVDIQQEALKWNELEARLIAAIATGNVPELAHGQAITCAAFQRQGLLRPLDDVVLSMGDGAIWEGIKRIGFHDGHQYGLVHAAGTSLLIYRKDIFGQKELSAPKTWSEFLPVLEALTEDIDGDGVIDRYGILIPASKLFLNIILAEAVKANGGRLFVDGKPALMTREVLETLDFFKDITACMPPDWIRYGFADTFKALAEGDVAMLYQGYGRSVGYVEKYASADIADGEHFATMVKPHGPSGSEPAVQVDAEPWMIFKQSPHADLAAEFLKYFYQDDNYVKYIASVPIHFFPITKSLRNNNLYHSIPKIKLWGQWLDVQEYYLSHDMAKPTLITAWEELDDMPFLMQVLDSGILSEMLIDIMYNGTMPEEAAQKSQKKLENFFQTIEA